MANTNPLINKLIFTAITSASVLFAPAQQYKDFVGAGNDRDIIVSSSSEADSESAANSISGKGLNLSLQASSRFLSQATLGADFETIQEVSSLGIEEWLKNQINLSPKLSYADTTRAIWEHFRQEYIDTYGFATVAGQTNEVLPYWFYWRMAWWNNTIKGDDLVRQRVAQALSQILVISEKSNLQLDAIGMASYYDILYNNAFGNYKDMLMQVSLHPCMGIYLSHMNNPKSDEANNIHPDENYAREIMQLFSIGLYELNMDGTRKLDSEGNPIATYTNDDIKELAKVFTGLGPAEYRREYEDVSNNPVQWGFGDNNHPARINMRLPMQMFESWHEEGSKTLLGNNVIPAGQSGMKDIEDAVEIIFNHPNVGPFISRILIQRLVKSNPTPAYIERVATIFNDDGKGERGNLGEVIKAILLDSEARSCNWLQDPHSAKLREPLLRYTQFMRAFNASNSSGRMWNYGQAYEDATQQSILSAPSVFNFYLPDYQPNGPIAEQGLVAPELNIHTTATSIDFINLVSDMVYASIYMEVTSRISFATIGLPDFEESNPDPSDVVGLDLSDELNLAHNLPALIDRLDIILAGGSLSETTKNSIQNTLENYAGAGDDIIVQTALFLTLISPDYAIIK